MPICAPVGGSAGVDAGRVDPQRVPARRRRHSPGTGRMGGGGHADTVTTSPVRFAVPRARRSRRDHVLVIRASPRCHDAMSGRSPLAGWAPTLGVFGVSLAVAFTAAVLVYLVQAVRLRQTRSRLTWAMGGGLAAVWLTGGLLLLPQWTRPNFGWPSKWSEKKRRSWAWSPSRWV